MDARADDALVLAARAGDKGAWDALVVRYSDFIYRNSRAVGADHALAEDIVQMVWMTLLNHIDRIQKPSSIRGWLAITSRNATRTELTKSNRTTHLSTELEIVDQRRGPADHADKQNQIDELTRCFDKLSDACRELLWMRFGIEMSLREISELRDMAMGSIGPTQGRCLEKLADCMGRST